MGGFVDGSAACWQSLTGDGRPAAPAQSRQTTRVIPPCPWTRLSGVSGHRDVDLTPLLTGGRRRDPANDSGAVRELRATLCRMSPAPPETSQRHVRVRRRRTVGPSSRADGPGQPSGTSDCPGGIGQWSELVAIASRCWSLEAPRVTCHHHRSARTRPACGRLREPGTRPTAPFLESWRPMNRGTGHLRTETASTETSRGRVARTGSRADILPSVCAPPTLVRAPFRSRPCGHRPSCTSRAGHRT